MYGGIFSGYVGGKASMILMRIVDNLIFPAQHALHRAHHAGAGLKRHFRWTSALCITSWIGTARVVRSEVMYLKHSEYVLEARLSPARSSGTSWSTHLIPNSMGPIIVSTAFLIPSAISSPRPFLSFLGMCIQAPMATGARGKRRARATLSDLSAPDDLPGHGGLRDDVLVQFYRRRPARRAGPAPEEVAEGLMTLLEVKNLTASFHISVGIVQAVRHVSFHLDMGESLGVVGESGSGKSVTMPQVMGLLSEKRRGDRGSHPLQHASTLQKIDASEFRKIPRRRHRHDLSGPDDQPQPPLHRGEPADRSRPAHPPQDVRRPKPGRPRWTF